MLNILVALRVWKQEWTNKIIEIHCDNAAVVSILNTGKTKDKNLATVSRNIFMLCAEYDISIKVSHIMGCKNEIADLLSRWDNSNNCTKKLELLVPNFSWVQIEKEMFQLDFDI